MSSAASAFDAGPEIKPAKRYKVQRRWRRVSGVQTAAEMIGPLEQGVEIAGLTNGQFSLIDIIIHILDQIGPAHVAISTWTMGIYETDLAAQFVNEQRFLSMRMMVDPSMFSRKPELAGALVQAFGIESFRAVNTHAKFATMSNDEWKITIRSSMNLNRNKRIESFDIGTDPELCAWYLEIIDAIWKGSTDSGGTQSEKFFATILDAFETGASVEDLAAMGGTRMNAGPAMGAGKSIAALGSGLKSMTAGAGLADMAKSLRRLGD